LDIKENNRKNVTFLYLPFRFVCFLLQIDLVDCIEWPSVECLNENSSNTSGNALKQVSLIFLVLSFILLVSSCSWENVLYLDLYALDASQAPSWQMRPLMLSESRHVMILSMDGILCGVMVTGC
jgi:hypothetical protein